MKNTKCKCGHKFSMQAFGAVYLRKTDTGRSLCRRAMLRSGAKDAKGYDFRCRDTFAQTPTACTTLERRIMSAPECDCEVVDDPDAVCPKHQELLYKYMKDLESQLASALAEVERLKKQTSMMSSALAKGTNTEKIVEHLRSFCDTTTDDYVDQLEARIEKLEVVRVAAERYLDKHAHPDREHCPEELELQNALAAAKETV